MKFKQITYYIVIGFLILCVSTIALVTIIGRDSRIQAHVIRVIDGDTVEVEIGSKTDTVRYIGMDTPETVEPGYPVECYGPQASSANKFLVEDKNVELELDTEERDTYGRLLAYVYEEGRFVNGELVEQGYATADEFKPNVKYADEFRELEQQARYENKGLWDKCK